MLPINSNWPLAQMTQHSLTVLRFEKIQVFPRLAFAWKISLTVVSEKMPCMLSYHCSAQKSFHCPSEAGEDQDIWQEEMAHK